MWSTRSFAAGSILALTLAATAQAAEPAAPAWRGGLPVREYNTGDTLDAPVLSVHATGRSAVVRWEVPAGVQQVNVYRRDGRGDWHPEGVAAVDAHTATFIDTLVSAGAKYAYCIGAGAGGAEAFGGEARTEIPGTFALAAHALVRDPDGGVSVSISLPEDAHVVIALIDAIGRRLWTRDHQPESAGVQNVRIATDVNVIRGEYRVTLAQGPRVAMARLTITD
jgi:hypothetical protein